MLTFFTLTNLFYIFLFLCLINGIINFYREYKVLNMPYDEVKKSFQSFLRYTDRYYINNLYYTYLACFIYLFGSIIIFLIIRYLFIGQIILFSKTEVGNVSISNVLIFVTQYILFICCLLFYKVILKKMFYLEILKLRIYLFPKHPIIDLIVFPRLIYICGFIWMITERISKSNYDPYLFDKDFDYWYEKQVYIDEYKYNSLYKNKYLQKLIFILISLSNNYILINLCFSIISRIFRRIHRHVEYHCFMFTPYIVFILVLLYETYHLEFYYIYYGSFILGLIIMYNSYLKFEKNFSFADINTLYDHFYGTLSNYKKERLFILKNEYYHINLNIESNRNLHSFFNIENSITYSVYNNLERYSGSSDKNKIHDIFLYFRNNITFVFIVITLYYLLYTNNVIFKIINVQTPLWLIVVGSIIIMIFCSNKAYYRVYLDDYTRNESFMNTVHNKKYLVIFGIITILQGYLFWLIIFKPQIMFLNTEILLQLPYNIIYIEKIYTVQEKIMYLFQYFEYYIAFFDSQYLDKDYLRYIIRQIKFKPLLYNNNITLQDLQVYVKLLIDTYHIQEIIIPELYQNIKEPNPWYLLLRNSIFVASLFSTICYVTSLYFFGRKLDTMENTHHLVQYIIQTAVYKKFTMSQFITIFIKIMKESKWWF